MKIEGVDKVTITLSSGGSVVVTENKDGDLVIVGSEGVYVMYVDKNTVEIAVED